MEANFRNSFTVSYELLDQLVMTIATDDSYNPVGVAKFYREGEVLKVAVKGVGPVPIYPDHKYAKGSTDLPEGYVCAIKTADIQTYLSEVQPPADGIVELMQTRFAPVVALRDRRRA